jgi:hypothetical protein
MPPGLAKSMVKRAEKEGNKTARRRKKAQEDVVL